MALPSTLFRFRIDLSDVDSGVYENLDFRVAQHPSETLQFLLTRVLAYALNFSESPEFSAGGLSDPDAPCISAPDPQGGVKLWIEIGNPSARKLHKAAKASKSVKVYTYKNPDLLIAELKSEGVYRAERIAVHSLAPEFLDRLAQAVERDNQWSVIHTEGVLTVTIGEQAETGELRTHSVV